MQTVLFSTKMHHLKYKPVHFGNTLLLQFPKVLKFLIESFSWNKNYDYFRLVRCSTAD